MTELPRIEDMPWLKEETQNDLEEMYRIYKRENSLMVPYVDIKEGQIYK